MADPDDPQDLIRELLQRELETVNLYTRMAESARTPSVRELVARITEQEKHHIAEAMDLLARHDAAQAAALETYGLLAQSSGTAVAAGDGDGDEARVPGVVVCFEPSGLEVEVGPSESLLSAALRSGIDVRHDCGGHGRCGTCRVEVLVGQMAFSSVTDPERKLIGDLLDENWRLACQSRPLGPARIRVPENVKLRAPVAGDAMERKDDSSA